MKAPKELYQNIIETMVPLHQFYGVKLLDIKDGFAKMLFPFREEMIGNPRGPYLHGGIIATALDSVGGAAGMTTLVSFEDSISTIDIRVDFLRPGKAKDFIVEAEITRSGNRILVTHMWAYHDTKDYMIAEGKAVYNVKRHIDPADAQVPNE